MRAVYRPNPRDAWQECELVGRHWPSGAYVLREVGRPLPGIWLGYPDQVRIGCAILEAA